jgi:hypothetical protein
MATNSKSLKTLGKTKELACELTEIQGDLFVRQDLGDSTEQGTQRPLENTEMLTAGGGTKSPPFSSPPLPLLLQNQGPQE